MIVIQGATKAEHRAEVGGVTGGFLVQDSSLIKEMYLSVWRQHNHELLLYHLASIIYALPASSFEAVVYAMNVCITCSALPYLDVQSQSISETIPFVLCSE
jgi:hypothetical protein